MDIPNDLEWGDYRSDLDLKYAHNLYGGLSTDEAQQHFITAPIERVSELQFAPFNIFKYYVFCFTGFLTSPESRDEADMASVFLNWVYEMAKKHPAELSEFYSSIESAVNHVSDNQSFYDADLDIYGSFHDVRGDIIKCINDFRYVDD